MPWCPKCKMEYEEGITVCSDCKIDLVESMEEAIIYVPLVQTEDEKIADKLKRYLEYSDLKSEISFDEENEMYVVSVDRKAEKQAKKLYKAFYYVEQENLLHSVMEDLSKKKAVTSSETSGEDAAEEGTEEEPLEEMDDTIYEQTDSSNDEDYEAEITEDEMTGIRSKENNSAYIMKADQYKDLASTVWIFLFFGIVGLIVVVLNIVGVLSFFNGWLPNAVLSLMFLFFLYVALSTNQKAKKIQSEIEAENELTKVINEWLQVNVTESFLTSLHNDTISEELNYIKMTDIVKEKLIGEFGTQNLAYLDRLIEEHYNNYIDQQEEEVEE